MPFEFDFDSGFVSIVYSTCIVCDTVTTYSNVNVSASYTGGDIMVSIGTSDSITGTVVWQDDITLNSTVALNNPNKALFYRIVGTTGTTLSGLRIKYS